MNAQPPAPAAMPGRAPHFPASWVGFGATDDELREFGRERALSARPSPRLLLARALLIVGFGAVASAADGPARLVALLLGLATIASAALAAFRWWSTPTRVAFGGDQLRCWLPFRRRRVVDWSAIAEIALVESPGRLGVGLRVDGGRPSPIVRRLSGGFDLVLYPRGGDCALLSRVLLRYCIDPAVRRRLPLRRADGP